MFHRVDGIWRLLLPEREQYFARFLQDYQTVRRLEGRGSAEAAYYRALPYDDLSGKMTADWRIRARSFDAFIARVAAPLEQRMGRPLGVLDLGAGNGWLSNRMALRGHVVGAVDLTINDFDGLGCHRFYDSIFVPVQAEFDHLPFAVGCADLAVFNASLHYSTDYGATLRETLRLVATGGRIVVLDSPVYHDAASGAGMVRERETQFEKQYGFASNSLPSENYLTYVRLDELGRDLGLKWHAITPFYGMRWALRPLLANLSGRREPARFHVLVGERK